MGDSVTQGCFETYKNKYNDISTVFDAKSSYEMGVFEILTMLYPSVPVSIINAGISGNRASAGLERVDRDVIRHEPDLTVVCFGLNDCKRETLEAYISALDGIFEKLKAAGSEIIFMTPNMMNSEISPHLTDPLTISIAEQCIEAQNNGIFEAYLNAAKDLCKTKGIPVCDCYAIWKTLADNGVRTTELLANKINHPTREMNKLFAIELVRTMFTEA